MTSLLASRKSRPLTRRAAQPYWLVTPALILIAIFIAIPVATVFVYSFFNYNASEPWLNGFAGLGNFVTIFSTDHQFWSSLLTTGEWVVVEVGLQFVFGLALALLLNRVFAGRGLVRAIAFAPWAISGVLATQIWLLIYNPATGISSVFRALGFITDFAPLVGPTSAFWSAIIAELWRGIPFFAILLLADMQSMAPTPGDSSDTSLCRTSGRRSFSPHSCGRCGNSTTLTCSTP
jgi:multiple sugar transport system permease protein